MQEKSVEKRSVLKRKKTMIRFYMPMLLLAVALSGCSMDYGRLAGAGMDAMNASTISEKDLQNVSMRMRAQEDSTNQVAPPGSPYSRRLRKLMANYTSVNGTPLNYKVYITPEVNANASPDGSVRVYSGLMDKMNDDELRFVLGHEIGHVAGGHSLNKMRMAYASSAARKTAGALSPVAGTLADSSLGDLAETFLNSQYSQKQELDADARGMQFLKDNGYDLKAGPSALRKLSGVGGFLSTHPSSEERARKLEEMAGLKPGASGLDS